MSLARMNAKTEAASTTETCNNCPEDKCTSVTGRLVGSSAPVVVPAGSTYRVVTVSPVPGTPSTTCLPSTWKVPFLTGTDVSLLVSVLPLWSVKVVTGSCAGMSPSSTANGPTAAVRLPQLPSQSI